MIKINIQNELLFLHIINEQTKLNLDSFYRNSITNEYMKINFKEMKHLHTESYKTSLKKTFKDLNKERGSPCFGLEDSI